MNPQHHDRGKHQADIAWVLDVPVYAGCHKTVGFAENESEVFAQVSVRCNANRGCNEDGRKDHAGQKRALCEEVGVGDLSKTILLRADELRRTGIRVDECCIVDPRYDMRDRCEMKRAFWDFQADDNFHLRVLLRFGGHSLRREGANAIEAIKREYSQAENDAERTDSIAGMQESLNNVRAQMRIGQEEHDI